MKAIYLWIGVLLLLTLIVFVYQQNQQRQKRGVQYMNEQARLLSQVYPDYTATEQYPKRKMNAQYPY